MRVRGASRAGGAGSGQDRWAATGSGAVLLDGASAIDPSARPADLYVEVLLAALVATLDDGDDLSVVLGRAIAVTAEEVGVVPGSAPSSTAVLVRGTDTALELAVLGDSTVVVGWRDGRTQRITDARIAAIATDLRAEYRRRLAEGHGYDAAHAELLVRMQQAQRAARNAPGGYWIAEADPEAARHAVVRRYPRAGLAWCVLATDGAQRAVDHLGIVWASLAERATSGLHEVLDALHDWEEHGDPGGALLPRSKRHDDKTLVVVDV